MKRYLSFGLVGLVTAVYAGSASADYNRVGVSYDNTHYGYSKELKGESKDEDPSFSTNGFGVNYIHGFKVSKTLPMFVEAGLNANFGFSNKTLYEDKEDDEKGSQNFQNINLAIPVNYTYHFNIGSGMTIAPYLGINFKLNLVSRTRAEVTYDGEKETSEWVSYFSEDDMGSKDATWNRFQMGWQVGVGAEWKKIYLGLQYGTDFIPAYSYSIEDFHAKVNTGTFKLMVGYTF